MKMSVLAALALAAPAASAQQAGPPPCSSAEYRQLDFWTGEWELSFTRPDGKPGKARNVIRKDELGPCVVSEYFTTTGMNGRSYSMYDPKKKIWRQMWVDDNGGSFVLAGGPVAGQPHIFQFTTTEKIGSPAGFKRMIWEKVEKDSLVWRWQGQQDDGSWKDLWVLNYRRAAPQK